MSANGDLVPNWMKEMQAKIELADAKEEVASQRVRLASLLIQVEKPKFWQHLKEKLKIAVDALPTLKLAGHFSAGMGERSIRVSMNRPGIFVSQTFTDLFFDSASIRCTTLNAGAYNLQFCAVSETEIAVVADQGNASPMDSDQTVEYIMRRMIQWVDSSTGDNRYTRT